MNSSNLIESSPSLLKNSDISIVFAFSDPFRKLNKYYLVLSICYLSSVAATVPSARLSSTIYSISFATSVNSAREMFPVHIGSHKIVYPYAFYYRGPHPINSTNTSNFCRLNSPDSSLSFSNQYGTGSSVQFSPSYYEELLIYAKFISVAEGYAEKFSIAVFAFTSVMPKVPS
jgi:hypothetical protein